MQIRPRQTCCALRHALTPEPSLRLIARLAGARPSSLLSLPSLLFVIYTLRPATPYKWLLPPPRQILHSHSSITHDTPHSSPLCNVSSKVCRHSLRIVCDGLLTLLSVASLWVPQTAQWRAGADSLSLSLTLRSTKFRVAAWVRSHHSCHLRTFSNASGNDNSVQIIRCRRTQDSRQLPLSRDAHCWLRLPWLGHAPNHPPCTSLILVSSLHR